jgi:hypothetical protein
MIDEGMSYEFSVWSAMIQSFTLKEDRRSGDTQA